MHRTRFIFGVSVLFLAAGIVVTAQQGNGNTPKSTQAPKPNVAKPTATKPATQKMAPAPQAAKAPHAPAAQSKVKPQAKPAATASNTNKTQTKPAKPVSTASKTAAKSPAAPTAKTEKTPAAKVAKTDGKTAKPNKPADTKLAKTEKKSDKPVKTAAAPTPTTLTPVQQKLKENTNLAAKVESRLPKGTDLMAASAGFKNLGQFVAAVNVSNNLGVSFEDLKTKMVTNNMSLGQAIQAVRPLTASPTIEAQRGEYDARGMISESEQAQSTTTASATAKAKPKHPAQ